MPFVTLRPVRADDLPILAEGRSAASDPWNFFGFRSNNGLERRFAADGFISESSGMLAIENSDDELLGEVSWHEVRHGPTPFCQTANIGIVLRPIHRGKGYGGPAQAALADYIFQTTLMERIEAETDVDSVAEQRALEKAGFQQEGLLRHAQFRSGQWRDLILFSRLRNDPAPAQV
jgi:RimJ/RimL family protein N-acetyltransferase